MYGLLDILYLHKDMAKVSPALQPYHSVQNDCS